MCSVGLQFVCLGFPEGQLSVRGALKLFPIQAPFKFRRNCSIFLNNPVTHTYVAERKRGSHNISNITSLKNEE